MLVWGGEVCEASYIVCIALLMKHKSTCKDTCESVGIHEIGKTYQMLTFASIPTLDSDP